MTTAGRHATAGLAVGRLPTDDEVMIGQRRRLGMFLTGLMICALAAGCSTSGPTLERFEYAQIIMAVEARITLYAEDETTARAAAGDAFDRMNALDAVMSDYRADSEVMRLCRAPAGEAVAVSPDLLRVLQASIDMSRQTHGAFDVTIGPVVRLWRDARRAGRLPDADALREARARTGWRLVDLDPAGSAVTLRAAGMSLDLGGIGKGFAVDEAIAVLRAAGAGRCLVNLGGDLAAWDPPPGEQGWIVEIETGAGAGAGKTPSRITLHRAAVATSGDLEQFIEIDDVRYSHIVNPATGLGLTNRRAVTVVAHDAITADALASALSVMDEGAERLLRAHGASAQIETPESAWKWRFPRPAVPTE
jgi:thiamine biosynthesis lipoprotein